MGRKPKFKPEIRRIKLNPEQAVLHCQCWDNHVQWTGETGTAVASSYTNCAAGARSLITLRGCGIVDPGGSGMRTDVSDVVS